MVLVILHMKDTGVPTGMRMMVSCLTFYLNKHIYWPHQQQPSLRTLKFKRTVPFLLLKNPYGITY